MILESGFIRYRVESNVIMDMFLVYMSSNNDFVSFQISFNKPIGYLMCNLRRNLIWHKALNNMISLYAIGIAKETFSFHHRLICIIRIASHARNINSIFCFITVDNIVDKAIQSEGFCKYLCYCHRFFQLHTSDLISFISSKTLHLPQLLHPRR